jgi:ribosome-associated protein
MAKTSNSHPEGTPQFPETVAAAIRAARQKQSLDIVVLDLREIGAFADYFVVCTGLNPRQIAAIAEGIGDTLREELGDRAAVVEGGKQSGWILLDYFNVVVHIFSQECREFYDLERLWGTAVRHEIASEDTRPDQTRTTLSD